MNAATGRRRRVAATTPRTRPGAGAVVAVVLVLGAVLAVVLTRTPQLDRALQGRGAGSVVDQTLLACPDNPTRGVRSTVNAGLAAVDGASGPLGGEGSLRAGDAPVSSGRGPLQTLPPDPAPTLDARGEVAAGLFATRTDALVRGGTALAVTPCVAPRADWWFTGAGAGLDHTSTLVVRNADPGPAVIDIEVLGQDGPVRTVATRGITVAPGRTTTVPLTDVAPQQEQVVVHVHASRGRVAAAVQDRYAPRAGAVQGLEWLTGAQEPARTVRVAGLPDRADSRALIVGNPSDSEALVDLEVSGPRGRFVPNGFQTLTVPPGAVRTLDLTRMLTAKEAAALVVRAQVPIVAEARSVRGDDTSYAGAVAPLSDPAAAVTPSGTTTTVQVTAGNAGATVRVVGYDKRGKATKQAELGIDPAATATWTPPRRTAYVLVTRVKGVAYGAATYAGDTGVAAAPLMSLPVTLAVPPVAPTAG